MQEYAGEIIIGTKVDNKGASKDLQKLYDKVEKNQEKIKSLLMRREGLDIDISKYEKKIDLAKEKTNELAEELERIAKEQLELDGLEITPANIEKAKQYLQSLKFSDEMKAGEYQNFTFRAKPFQEISEKFDKLVDTIEDGEREVDLLKEKYDSVDREIQKCEINQIKYNQEIQNASKDSGGMNVNFANIEKNISKVTGKFGTMLKKVGKIALALVGVRTIINLITRSFNTLAQYNTELGTKMEQMRLVLAVGLEPIINWLVSMLHTILSLINQIYSALSGIDLFGRASELWSNKMAKNMASGAGSAKEIKKQLAGFDEMNVLSDNETSGGGGGGSSNIEPWTLQPEFDWSKFDIHKIMDKAKEIVDGLIKGINKFLQNADPKEIADGISTFIIGTLDIITKTFTDLDWQQLGKTFIEVLTNLDWAGILTALIENIIGSLTWPIDLLIGLIDGLVEFFESPDCVDKMIEGGIALVTGLVKGLFTLLTKISELGVKLTIAVVKIMIELGQRAFEKGKEWTTKLINFIKDDGIEKVKQWIKDFIENTKAKIMEFVSNIKAKIQPLIDWLKEKIDGIKSFLRGFADGIKIGISSVVIWIAETFNKVTNFFKGVGVAIGDFFSGAIKGAVNGVLSWVESKVNWFIDKINSVISLINKIPGVSIGKLSRISLPRLATGGIVNQPGRGVPVGNAIVGESGREGVLPLTDRQTMMELGKEIGKWININATIPVSIGNRQVARIIEEISADREFAMNS